MTVRFRTVFDAIQPFRLLPVACVITLIALSGCIIDPPPTPDGGTPAEQSVLCAPGAVEITIAYMPLGDEHTTDDRDWVPEAMRRFSQAYLKGKDPITGQPLAAGEKPICITGKEEPSGIVRDGIERAVRDPSDPNGRKPTIFQPAVSTWLSLINHNSRKTLFPDTDIYPVALSPVAIAIWQSRLDAIRRTVGYNDIGWEELLAVLTSPNGWQDYGVPNGPCTVSYGHTDPFISSTGLSTLVSEFYASARANGFSDRTLTLEAVNRPDIQQGVRDIEHMIRHYARNTTIFKNYIADGPDYVDFVALPENDLISINLGRTDEGKPPEPLVALYPKEGTFWHEHPFGIVHADWATEEQREAGRKFVQFVLTPDIQRIIMSLGFRPANTAVPLEAPLIPENGIDPAGPAVTLDVPPADVVTTIQNSWALVRKHADIVLLIDVSGSMAMDGKLDEAKRAALAFLDQIPNGNRVELVVFNNQIRTVVPMTSMEGNRQRLRDAIAGLSAADSTVLYKALLMTLDDLARSAEANRIRAVVLLSDGEDSEGVLLNDVLKAIQKTQQSEGVACHPVADPLTVIPVAYGSNAENGADDEQAAIERVLNQIANASHTKVVRGDPASISEVLKIIASYF